MNIFESTFPNDFRSETIKQILDNVLTGNFCQFVCIPGSGKATILRLLAHNRNLLKFHLKDKEKSLRFIYLNFLELTSFEESTITKFLLLTITQKTPSISDPLALSKQLVETVNKLSDEEQTIVFLLDHFDEYQNRLPRAFFQMLKSIKTHSKYKFSVVFATRRDLLDLLDEEIVKQYWDFFVGNTVYLNIFDENATEFLFEQIEKVFSKKLSRDQRLKITKLSGGHTKLTKILTELVLGQNEKLETETLLKNLQVRAVLLEIWLFLTSLEQHELYELAQNGKSTNQTDENLIKLDLIRQKGQSQVEFSIPIFEEFIKTMTQNVRHNISYNPETREIQKGASIISELLSAQEYRLLKFLLQNQGKIIERDELISAVWPQTKVTEAVSDEAIDQMVFRLRKKIEDEPAKPKYIQTVKGRGLKFEQ